MYSFPLNGPISSAPRNLEVLDAQLSGNDSGRLLANHQGGTVGVGTHILRTDGNLKREKGVSSTSQVKRNGQIGGENATNIGDLQALDAVDV